MALDQHPTRKILALDQASHTTGWSYFENDKLIDWGHFTLNGDVGDRLVEMKKRLLDFLKKYEPTEVYFEDIQLQRNVMNNVQTFKVLAEVFGVIFETLEELQIENSAVLAATWKSTLGIRGKNRPEQKKNAQLFVQNLYNIKCTQDEADAICIGTHAVRQNPFDEGGFDWS